MSEHEKKIGMELFQHECEGTARTLARNHEATVVFQGDDASTDGSTIILPSLPADATLTERQARVARGYVDHESAHQRYTEMGLLKKIVEEAKATDSMRVPMLTNAVEDIRIEKETCRDYPGSKKNLEATADATTKHFLEEVLPNEDTDVIENRDSMMPVAITWAGRKQLGYGSPSLDEALAKLPESVRAEAEMWAKEILESAKSTRDSYKIAKAIALKKKEWEDQDDEPGEGKGGDGEGEGDGEGTARGGGGGVGSGALGEGDDEVKEHFPSEDAGAAIKGEWASSKAASSGYRPYSTKDDKVHTRHDPRQKYSYTKEDGSVTYPASYNLGYHKLRAYQDAALYHKVKQELAAPVNVMKSKFQRCLMDMARRDWDGGKEHGYLDSRRLVMASRGEPNVYKIRQDTPELDTAVMIHIDLSGSMSSGIKARLAKQTAVAMAEMLSGAGIPYEVTGFSDEEKFSREDERDKVHELYRRGRHDFHRFLPIDRYIFKAFDESLRDAAGCLAIIDHCIGSNNCDGEHVMWAGKRLLTRPEKRKVLFVLSDGYPAFHTNDMDKARTHLRSVVKGFQDMRDFTLIGIGMQSDAVQQFYDLHEVVNKIEDLPGVVMGHMAKVLMGEKVELDNSKLLKAASGRAV